MGKQVAPSTVLEEEKDTVTIWVDIDDIVPYDNNPRVISETAVDAVAAVIEDVQFKQPLVLGKGNRILVGHTRFLAAKKLGYKKVPCWIFHNLTEEQETRYRLLDNQSATHTEWDRYKLKVELMKLDLQFKAIQLNFSPVDLQIYMPSDEAYEDPDQENPPISTAQSITSEWKGMPGYDHEDLTPFFTCKVHFQDKQSVLDFAKLVGQTLDPEADRKTTKYIWFPEVKPQPTTKSYAGNTNAPNVVIEVEPAPVEDGE